MGKDGFQGLKIWQRGKELAVQVYKIIEQGIRIKRSDSAVKCAYPE
jgi:hypothetical protein